jgi:CheY-like chemotaxis protein
MTAAATREILIVDDHPDAVRMLSILLGAAGYVCHVATTGNQALEQMRLHAPRIALLDIGLPDISGLELARRFRASHGNDIFLIALTGWGEPADLQRAFDAGFDRHLLKPVDGATIRAIIDAVEGQPASAS